MTILSLLLRERTLIKFGQQRKDVGICLIFAYFINELSQRSSLLVFHQRMFADEVVKVLEQGVAVRLGVQRGQPVEMMNVNVHEDAEQSREDLLAGRFKRFGEFDVGVARKYRLVADLSLNPVEELLVVVRRGQRPGFLELGHGRVLPEVLVLLAAGHDRAGLVGADFGYGAVQELRAVEEVHHVDGQPIFVRFFFGLFDRLLQFDARVQRFLGLSVQIVAQGSLGELFLPERGHIPSS